MTLAYRFELLLMIRSLLPHVHYTHDQSLPEDNDINKESMSSMHHEKKS